jgi:hypothetical protein
VSGKRPPRWLWIVLGVAAVIVIAVVWPYCGGHPR